MESLPVKKKWYPDTLKCLGKQPHPSLQTLETKVTISSVYPFSTSNSLYGSLIAFKVPLITSSALES